MINIATGVKDDVLTITVNLKERHGNSKSGKTVTIASTQGNQKLAPPHDGVSFGLNVYTKEPPK
jgi:DNA-directed RNA polymerase alpha subunit